MFLVGCRWDYDKHLLGDSSPKELYNDVPVIHFIPIANKEQPKNGVYLCPLYKILSRCDTFWHSSNYIMNIEMPVLRCTSETKWIKAGVSMVLSLK